MNRKLILKTEFLKFLVAVIAALLMSRFAFQSFFREGVLDIHFHDTYFVIDPIGFGLILFTPVYYLVQLLHLGFTRRIVWPAFLLFLFSALLLLFVLYRFHLFFLMVIYLYTNGSIWIGSFNVTMDYFDFKDIYRAIFFILLSLIWICIKFGLQKRKLR